MALVTFTMLFNAGIIPNYILISNLGLINTRWAIILPGAINVFNMVVLRTAFEQIPESLEEAAKLEGASEAKIFTSVIIPLCKPIIVYQIISSFLVPWGDFVFAKLMLNSGNAKDWTVAIGLYNMLNKTLINRYFAVFCAGGLLVSIPIAILFVIMQKYYVAGITGGSVKG